jgi:hypothetical protein
VDDHTFDVRLVDAGQTVSARVFLDDGGHPVNFSTTDRYADLPGGLVRAEWTTSAGIDPASLSTVRIEHPPALHRSVTALVAVDTYRRSSLRLLVFIRRTVCRGD